MSDITGPPLPKPIEPVARPTGKPGTVSKDPRHTGGETRNEKQDSSAKNEQADPLRGREPAVSIAASAAHLEVGEQLKEQVRKIDYEGRPIIVTEEATFALRPDAGLRPGDDVKLEIIDTGKQVVAELLEKNGRAIDPPIRLALIVIALHVKDRSEGDVPQPQAPLPASTGYAPPRTGAYTAPRPEADTLANFIAARPLPVSAPPGQPESPVAPQQGGFQAQDSLVTGNPDPISGRSSSSDLATLIAAQQSAPPRQPSAVQPPLTAPPPSQLADAGHLIPKSALTEIELSTHAAPADGLGPAIAAFTFTGAQKALQAIDPSISSVPPAQVAEVTHVRPLPPLEAKSLPLPINAFQSAAALAVVDTDKGSFIAPLNKVAGLAGELVKISEAPEASAQTAAVQPQQTFTAKLIQPGRAERTPVLVALSPDASPGAANAATVKAVHTIRAFLTPEGPKTDLRLETSRGEILLTLPNAVRPTAGDELIVLPAMPTVAPGMTPAATMPVPLTDATALATLGAHAWPSLQQAFALTAGASAGSTGGATATQMASRGAEGGAKLANSLLFFLSAAGRGDPGAWLGQEAERILADRDRPLLETLKHELSRLMGAATDKSAEWRPVLLPLDPRTPDMPLIAMLLGPPPRQLDPDGGQGRSGGEQVDDEKAQRFVLEVQFSILGAIQLDGLIKGRQFDLALRSEKPLPASLRHDAAELFDAALAANGFGGRLNIIEATPFPVNVEKILSESLAAQPA